MVTQILLVQHLQANVLDLGDDLPRPGQLPVGEDVAVDEISCDGRGSIVRPGNAMVEQQAAGLQSRLQKPEVSGIVRDADVLGQPDRRDRVELSFCGIAIVRMADLR